MNDSLSVGDGPGVTPNGMAGFTLQRPQQTADSGRADTQTPWHVRTVCLIMMTRASLC
jgi:hypothetical protein